MKRILIVAAVGLFGLATGCSTCPNPYDYSSPVVSPGYPAGGYSTPQPMYNAAPPQMYTAPPAGYSAAPPANTGYVGQPTPATAKLTPVDSAGTR